MSNGVEVLVRDKNANGKQEQRKLKFMHVTSLKSANHELSSSPPKGSLLTSAVATVVNRQQMGPYFPIHQLMQHNYIIKTCMTTYTYLTTVVQNKRSAVSTFETIVSVITTESLTNLYATDVLAELKPTKTKYMEVKTIQPSASNMFLNNVPKIDKRIDSHEEHNFDLIQPSEISHIPCTTLCSCSHTKTETLKTKYTNPKRSSTVISDKYNIKTTKYSDITQEVRPTHKEEINKTKYHPYEYEVSSQVAPTDKIVEKYTQVNDYSDEKDSNSMETNDLLTNEQAPPSIKTDNDSFNKTSEKVKPNKPQKVNKNKFDMAELIKLGSLGIKGLSQLAPVIEKMTGGFIKRQEINKATTTTTTTVKPVSNVISYNANKRVDTDLESRQENFPKYIPVDEMETSETQIVFTNATLHQNFAWAAEHKNSIGNLVKPKIIHESPLVNGGIPISPGEIITANSDVIVGKPAIGGPLTLGASGLKLHNPVLPPPIDNVVANNEQYITREKPFSNDKNIISTVDDSFDLRPPEVPKLRPKPIKNSARPLEIYFGQLNPYSTSSRLPTPSHSSNEPIKQLNVKKNSGPSSIHHSRPAFLDYIPSFSKPINTKTQEVSVNHGLKDETYKEEDLLDNSPSSSEIVSTKIITDGQYARFDTPDPINKPFLVDIQPSKVANVLIPHGSSTALVFAGSSEPHKTGDYVDDPLPYPEPGYFGSFSIDAPHMTNVHNVVPNKNVFLGQPNVKPSENQFIHPLRTESQSSIDQNTKRNENKRLKNINKLPSPQSNQDLHSQGPRITAIAPDFYGTQYDKNDQIKFNKSKEGKEIIDKEYENYLAVPPPPLKVRYNQDHQYDKDKIYHQRQVAYTKPIQDGKVLLNVQSPVSNQLPPKVTSEIYFASQLPSNQHTQSYTLKFPQSQPAPPSNKMQKNNYQVQKTNNFANFSNSHLSSFSNTVDKSLLNNKKDNSYSLTNGGKPGHVMGSSISVPIMTSSHNGQLNANIPIGTNFAIRVEDDPLKYESVALHGKINPSFTYDGYSHQTDSNLSSHKLETKLNISETSKVKENKPNNLIYTETHPIITPSKNSHANFPMINEEVSLHISSKPTLSYDDDLNLSKVEDLTKSIQNISTNSHGWYSSVLNEANVKNIKVETSVGKVIPLYYDSNADNLPEFGEKIATVGKPPAEFWQQNNKQFINNFGIGKPFSRTKFVQNSSVLISTPRPNYIPSRYGVKQPVYDIPMRDYNDETTTGKDIYKKPTKPVYETAEEIYDGDDDMETNEEHDGEVSSESMRIPIVSSSIEKNNVTTVSGIQLPQNVSLKITQYNNSIQLINFNPGTQTEKPFNSNNKTTFQSNNIQPINHNPNIFMKPRPFAVNTVRPLDHQLQQPHWQINQLLENATNMSYEDNLELNIGEEIYTASTFQPPSTNMSKSAIRPFQPPIKKGDNNTKISKFTDTVLLNRTNFVNDANIITSTVHIKDKKPIIVEVNEKPTFTLINSEENGSSSEILDLSPPPPIVDHNYKPSKADEIMGMNPPPPRVSPSRYPSRAPQTPRPILTIRTPPPYRTLPPRTLPPRQSTQKPLRKPVTRDDISTYRPTYDIRNKIKEPTFNLDQPSSHLLPPPKGSVTTALLSEGTINPSTIYSATSIIFPTPLSSGWLTSSNIGFSSSFNFAPTSVYLPERVSQYAEGPSISLESSSENDFNSYEYESSSELVSNENPAAEKDVKLNSRDSIIQNATHILIPTVTSFYEGSISSETSSEDTIKASINIISLGNKNRTRKPYPIRNEDKKISNGKIKLPSKTIPTIKPSRTLPRPEISYPPRISSIKKIVRPLPSRPLAIFPSNVIESSESMVEEDFIRPTEVLQDHKVPTIAPDITSIIEKTVTSTLTINKDLLNIKEHSTHHAGNEIKISDEIIPTKTEFKTTVITLTETLSEPPQTVSSIGYLNLTHTLTVTHTEISLLSQSEGAITQTLVLTNTHTSTVVDVITEVYTHVQPTTIVETVTKHVPTVLVEPTPVISSPSTVKVALDDIAMSSEESDNFIIRDSEVTENIQKIETDEEKDNDTFFVVMNKSQNGGKSPPINNDIETGDYEGITRNEQVNSNGVSQVLFGEILLAGTPYLETTNIGRPSVTGYGKECQPDCKASRNERCQRIDGIMKCVCRPGFARMFPDRPCKPTYTYSVRLALESQGNKRLIYKTSLSDNSSQEYQSLAHATHEGINRMIMQSDLRDVYHGVQITGFNPVEIKSSKNEIHQGVINNFYVQLSDNAHESRLKEVIEKYLRNNNYSLGGTEVHAAEELIERLNVSDFDECVSTQFHDCSEHSRCFNLRGTYTCSCLEGYADLSVNTLYPGRICSSDAVGCGGCSYHGTCFERDSTMICECFKWYAGRTCQINLKAVLITVTVIGAVIILVVTIWASKRCCCQKGPATQTFVIGCMQGMPSLHQANVPSKQRADRRALIAERTETAETCSVQNASLPYIPAKSRSRSACSKKCVISDPPNHAPPPPPAPALMIPRARLHPLHSDSRDNLSRKKSAEICNEAKLISYLESGATNVNDEMRRKHSVESSYSVNKERPNKQGALVSAGFKVSTTVRPDENSIKEDRDDTSSINKTDLDGEMSHFDTLRKYNSQEDMSEWTDAERRIGELTLSEARSVGGTLPASTGRAASSTRLTHQEANTMAERDLGSTFLLPHVHLYKPDLTSDVSEFDSL